MCELMSRFLASEGFEVAYEYDGISGLARRKTDDFDLAVVDIMMPRKNGMDLLRDIVADAVFEAEPMGKTVVYSELTVCFLMADKLWISGALDNVIRNGIRHTQTDSSVDINLLVQEYNVCVNIRDHGEGVEEEKLEHLFDPFFRASEAREHDGSGYGLGLAIVRRAIEMHGGNIVAHNHPDGGLQVDIRLPLTE